MAHLCELHVYLCASLKVYKNEFQFLFHCSSEEVLHVFVFDMNWSIKWVLIQWGLVGICLSCAEVMISSRSVIGFRI